MRNIITPGCSPAARRTLEVLGLGAMARAGVRAVRRDVFIHGESYPVADLEFGELGWVRAVPISGRGWRVTGGSGAAYSNLVELRRLGVLVGVFLGPAGFGHTDYYLAEAPEVPQ